MAHLLRGGATLLHTVFEFIHCECALFHFGYEHQAPGCHAGFDGSVGALGLCAGAAANEVVLGNCGHSPSIGVHVTEHLLHQAGHDVLACIRWTTNVQELAEALA